MMEMNYCNEKDYQMVSGYVCERMIPGAWAGRRIVLVFEEQPTKRQFIATDS